MEQVRMTETEVSNNFAAVLEKVGSGAEIVVERDHRPVALITPITRPSGLGEGAPETREEQEARWLVENRRRYAGKWIALDGERLLAVGETAKDVFAATQSRAEPPLVMKVDDSYLPFAGW